MSTKRVLIMIGAIATAVSVFFPFVSMGAMGIGISFSLFDLAQLGGLGGSTPVEIYVYIAGAALALIAFILVLLKKAGFFPVISGLVALGAGIWVLISFTSQLNQLMGGSGLSGVSAGMGFGFWVYLVGAVLQIVGTFLKEPAPVAPPPYYPPQPPVQ